MDPSLHCPTCGYNLTGLPENRCPECGAAFSPEELRRLALAGFDHVSTRAMMYYLLSAPVAFWFLNAINMRWNLPDLVGVAGAMMIAAWGVANAFVWTKRATEFRQPGEGTRPMRACVGCFLTAVLLQLIVGAGPCMIMV